MSLICRMCKTTISIPPSAFVGGLPEEVYPTAEAKEAYTAEARQRWFVNPRNVAEAYCPDCRYRMVIAERDRLRGNLESGEEDILANRYTEDQGMDQEMKCYNDGLEDAVRILQGKKPESGKKWMPATTPGEEQPE